MPLDLLINTANIFYVVAYFTTHMLRLRVLTTAAALCLAVYFLSQPVPMWNVVAWNAFFFALNIFQITRLLRARNRTA
jgi:hypothetical protein